MRVSIIIPTLNEENYIGQLIRALLKQTLPPDEILVVDGGSDDKTRNIVRGFTEVSLFAADKPAGNQRDVGGRKAHSDLLVFLDADTLPHKNFIKSVVKEMTSRKLTVACPHYIPYPGSTKINAFYAFFNSLFSFSQNRYPSGAGSCICVHKMVFDKAGGFNKNLRFDDIAFIRHASAFGRFGFLKTPILVSDRRIRTYGLLSTVITYSALSVLFLVGAYRMANHVPYIFGKFTSLKKNSV